jgi:hypothetical protein
VSIGKVKNLKVKLTHIGRIMRESEAKRLIRQELD